MFQKSWGRGNEKKEKLCNAKKTTHLVEHLTAN